MRINVQLVDHRFILTFRKGLFLLYSWNEGPFLFCRLNLKFAKYGRKWNLKGDYTSGIQIKITRTEKFLWFFFLCQSTLISFSALVSWIIWDSECFVKAITGDILNDKTSWWQLITGHLCFKMWHHPLAFALISTYVHSVSLQGMLLKVWQGLKIHCPQRQIWQSLMKLPACASSVPVFNTETNV